MDENNKGSFCAGWGQADITPDKPIFISGQFHARVSEGVQDPVTATALILGAERAGSFNYAIMVSCDLITITKELRDEVYRSIKSSIPEIDASRISIGATHTHSAPEVRNISYGMDIPDFSEEYGISDNGTGRKEKNKNLLSYLGVDVMFPVEYVRFAGKKISQAICDAWNGRKPLGMAYGLGHAVVGRNRRLSYRDGTSAMYGKANVPEFSHVEGYEDHSVYAMMTYDINGKLIGIIVNIACPSQVSENSYVISADFWHETREELRRRFGKEIYIMAQCGPAGDQSPHLLIGKRAEERMWRLKGRKEGENASR